MPPGESDPAAVESIAVTREDLVTAYEHALRGGEGRAVLRLTPPFHARMRARIHVVVESEERDVKSGDSVDPGRGADRGDRRDSGPDGDAGGPTDAAGAADAPGAADDGEPAPIKLPPERLIDAERAPDPPTPDETEDALRADPAVEYSVERHRERHAAAMERWRDAVGAAARDRVEIETPTGSKTVEVKVLGADEGGSGSEPPFRSEPEDDGQ